VACTGSRGGAAAVGTDRSVGCSGGRRGAASAGTERYARGRRARATWRRAAWGRRANVGCAFGAASERRVRGHGYGVRVGLPRVRPSPGFREARDGALEAAALRGRWGTDRSVGCSRRGIAASAPAPSGYFFWAPLSGLDLPPVARCRCRVARGTCRDRTSTLRLRCGWPARRVTQRVRSGLGGFHGLRGLTVGGRWEMVRPVGRESPWEGCDQVRFWVVGHGGWWGSGRARRWAEIGRQRPQGGVVLWVGAGDARGWAWFARCTIDRRRACGMGAGRGVGECPRGRTPTHGARDAGCSGVRLRGGS